MTRSPANRRVQLAFGSAILAMLAVGALSYRGLLASRESERWVLHTHNVLEDVESLELALETSHASSRDFVLTGDASCLDRYRDSSAGVARYQASLARLTADNPSQQVRLAALRPVVASTLASSERLILLRQAGGMQPAIDAMRAIDLVDAVAAGTRRPPAPEFEQRAQDIAGEEVRLLSIRSQDSRRRVSQLRFLLLSATTLSSIIALTAGWGAARDSRRRKKITNELGKSEQRLRTLLDGVKDHGIFMLDPDGAVVSWSKGAERITGYTAEDMIGCEFSCLYLPEQAAAGKLAKVLRCAIADGQFEEQGIQVRRNGLQFFANVSLTPLQDMDGSLLGFAGISRDMTETRASEAKYRSLIEAAPDGMVVFDQSGAIVLLNARAEKQFGYRSEELAGRKITDLIPSGLEEQLGAARTSTPAPQSNSGLDLIALRSDGSEFPIELMLSPLKTGGMLTAGIRDITLRRAAELHLAKLEGRYRGLLEAAPDAMLLIDPAGVIVLVNRQTEKQFGYRRDELVGQQVSTILLGGVAEEQISAMVLSSPSGQTSTALELHGRHNGGGEFPIEIMLSRMNSGEGVLVAAAIRDITTRRQAEAHLLQKLDELKRSNEELEQFAYVASHDLQEPLRMVASYTQLLSRRYKGRLDSDADEFIAFAVDGASRMQRLIQDLLSYSRVGTQGKDLADTAGEDALGRSLKILAATIKDAGAVVTHDPLPHVLADESQLVQLFQNLIGNGIKYRNRDSGVPRIHVSASSSGTKWTFSVQDNGMGIDRQYFERIFGMFQRLHKREDFAGTGIGLAICKKIVERHGGNISVESQPGVGSTFRFALTGETKAWKSV
ncbi:MAG TPA: PAS domain S-box protein [Acidisarcina sp.]